MKKQALIAMTMIAALCLGACGQGGGNAEGSSTAAKDAGAQAVTAAGSSALLPLAKDAADAFKAQHKDVSITVNGGGSGVGLKQVADGTVQIGNSDVAPEEKLDPAQAKDLVDHKVCVVTMVPVVNKDLAKDLESLSKEDLIKVFTGKVKNWKEVGGPGEEIVLVSRPSTSGTRAIFEKYALDGNAEATNEALETDDSGTLLESVASQKGAIGYVAFPYLKQNDKVAALGIDGVIPSLEATYNGDWPVWGYEHMVTKGEPQGAVKDFISFILSDEYGKRIEEQGYNVTAKMKVER